MGGGLGRSRPERRNQTHQDPRHRKGFDRVQPSPVVVQTGQGRARQEAVQLISFVFLFIHTWAKDMPLSTFIKKSIISHIQFHTLT